jgi:hypothetical protein
MAPTPKSAQTTNTERPAGVAGLKSPYPIVLKAMKPMTDDSNASPIHKYKDLQKYNAIPKSHFSV